ncbi:hypothetical protein [Streptomyces sp. MST-110588]|uniref:hypothetical protein n=1 Tax=Streptomyces sp. MST-110588 TaxID=2833628 RepID=UPI001F5C517A|nr:hypothetical protein [Streptomyces sp. MST-110588]UNO42175.1 hypothetical protein KGS77_24970 [Streptomyces sp. MST-110588]
MSYLPTLRREHKGAIVLDGSAAAHEQIRALADLYREDPEGVGDMLIQIADLKGQVECERDLDGLGHAEHVRDEIVSELLDEIGGAETRLDPRDNHHALMQARSLAHQARRIGDAAQQRADELAALTAVARGVREERRRPPVC